MVARFSNAPTPKTLPGMLPMRAQLPGDFRSPGMPEIAAETLGGEPMPRTSAEFWAQRMSGMAPQSADKRYQLPAFGRRRRGGEGDRMATPATPAMPAASSLPASPVRADGAGRLYRR